MVLRLLWWVHAKEGKSTIRIFTHTYLQREIFTKGRWRASHPSFPPSDHVQCRLSSDLCSSLKKEVSSRKHFGWASHESPLKDSWQWSKCPLYQSLIKSGTFHLFSGYQRTWPKNCPLGETVDSTFIGFKWENQVQYSTNENKSISQNKVEFEPISQLTQQQN